MARPLARSTSAAVPRRLAPPSTASAARTSNTSASRSAKVRRMTPADRPPTAGAPAPAPTHVHGPDCAHGHEHGPGPGHDHAHESLDPNLLLKQQPVYRTEPKVGRNDACPCGSGKKYKK